jgi:hypothetical protein
MDHACTRRNIERLTIERLELSDDTVNWRSNLLRLGHSDDDGTREKR